MKKVIGVLTVLVLCASCLFACTNTNSQVASTEASPSQTQTETTASTTSGSDEVITLHFLQYSPEYTDQMNAMAEEYNKVNPNVKIEFQILQNDYNVVLKSCLNSGNVPDVFMTEANNDNKVYYDYCYDLTNEPFMSEIRDNYLGGVTYNGQILGYPLFAQSMGIIYNKDIFATAGITDLPQTLSELEEVCKTLQAYGVTPFANAYMDWWVFKCDLQAGMMTEDDPHQTIEDLNSGAKSFSDLTNTQELFNLIDLKTEYGEKNSLESNFDAATTMFAKGEAAMYHMGSWAEPGITAINPDINIGYIPVPVNENPEDSYVLCDSNIIWRVYKGGQHVDAVLDWLEWLTTSDYGKNFVPQMIKETSTLKNAGSSPAQLANATTAYMDEGKTGPWVMGLWPSGFDSSFGEEMQSYIGGIITKDQAIDEISKAWTTLYNAQQ